MPDSPVDSAAAQAAAMRYAREVIAMLASGAVVGHANRELADWEGVVEADRRGQWRGADDVRVRWTAGTDGKGGPLAGSKPGWVAATSITVKGQCPDCARPAHYVSAGNQHDRTGGWHHDARLGRDTCWAGKAAVEATRITGPVPEDGTTPGVIEGTIATEDIIRANMRAAGFPIGSASDARAISTEAEQWAQNFAAAGRAEDPIVIGLREQPKAAQAGETCD